MPGHVRLVTLFYSTTATNMSKKITKVNVATGSTYVIANFLNGITHVREVVLPEGLVNIRGSAFYGATA